MPNHLKLIRGDTWMIAWTWKDNDGQPIDLTGAIVDWALESAHGEIVASAGVAEGSIEIELSSAKCFVTVKAADTAEITPGAYRCDMQVTYADGTVQSSPVVNVIVTRDVTP